MNIEKCNRINSIVYSIGGIWALAIIFNTLSNDFTQTNLLGGLRDISEVAITLFVYWAIDQIRRPKNFIKAAETALRQLHNENKDITKFGTSKKSTNQTAEQHLFFSKKQEAPFIPLEPLKNGILEIRISYRTLDNFDYDISPKDNEKENKIANAKQLVNGKVLEYLKNHFGENYYKIETTNSQEIAVRISFPNDKLTPEQFEKVICDCGNLTIETLKNNATKK